MGLDISAYKGIKKINAKLNDDGYAVDSETNNELLNAVFFVPKIEVTNEPDRFKQNPCRA